MGTDTIRADTLYLAPLTQPKNQLALRFARYRQFRHRPNRPALRPNAVGPVNRGVERRPSLEPEHDHDRHPRRLSYANQLERRSGVLAVGRKLTRRIVIAPIENVSIRRRRPPGDE